jgi:cytochrome c-type biogenesis protein
MTPLLDGFASTLTSGGLLALPAALLGGVVTGLNPCCLPVYPAAAATCSATRTVAASADAPSQESARPALARALAFAVGMALATTILGITAALAGHTLTGLGGWAAYAIALVPLTMGAHQLGFLRLPLPRVPGLWLSRGSGVTQSFTAGLLLSLVLAPCGTAVLASVLSYAALSGHVAYGALLLMVYGLGASLPVLALGTAAGRLAARLDAGGARRWVDWATGGVLVGLGFFLLWQV